MAVAAIVAAGLQAGYVSRLRTFATGHMLTRWLRADYSRGLIGSRKTRHGLIDVAGTGRVVYYDYTLHHADGRWKVTDEVGWRFLDVPSGRVTYDPPHLGAQQP
jgi:hypothetical protein